MKWRKWDLKIGLLTEAILVVLTLAAGLSAYLVMQQEAQAILKRNLSALLQDDMRTLSQEIQHGIGLGVTVATRPFVINNLKAIDAHPNDTKARRSLDRVAQSFLPMGLSAVAFVGKQGQTITQAGSFRNPEFTVHLNTKQEAFLLWDQQGLLQTIQPVVDGRQRLGYVITQVPLLFIANMVPVVRALGHTADLAVCAPLGMNHMRCLPDTLHPNHYIAQPVSQWIKGQALPMRYALMGQSGLIYARDYLGKRVVAVYAPVDDTGLGMVLKIRQSELFEGVTAQLKDVTALVLALLLAGMLLMRSLVLPLLRERTEAEEETRAANSQLRMSEARTQALLAHVADGVIVIDERGLIETFNAAAEQIFGYEAAEIIGKNVSELMPEPHRSQHNMYLERYHETGKSTVLGVSRELAGVRRTGERFPLEIKIREVRTETIHLFIAAIRDITEEKEAAQRTLYMATHDALTDLPNRLLLADRLERALIQARRAQNRVALLFLDLDGFKTINDSLGHATGDMVLTAVAQRLMTSLRATDTVARHGGDEFVVVLGGFTNVEAIDMVTRKLLANLIQPYRIQNQDLYIGASVGITVYPDDGEDSSTLLKNCDLAMYRAKETGGNARVFFAPEMNKEVVEKQFLSTDLHQALGRNEFRLHYQPVVDFACGLVVGLEALVRWQHPTQGLLAPGQFIALAEETGLILPIGEWVLTAACAQWQAWTAAGLEVPPIAVNISARQFHGGNLVATVTRILEESGVPPDHLILEITESVVMRDIDATIETLRALHAIGLRIAIDDFGTGYSSLGYLKRLPASILKIDQLFVRDIALGGKDTAVVTAIIGLAHSLRMTVIAEGVETEEQRIFLRDQGCDQYQGYYFSKPLPPAEVMTRFMGTC
ncbi:MAG TPA: EAL domain-containing protein [Acidiferrobacter sp.]|nr:EAL domain-containing protein [Acidiferrobacter sp.]